MSKCKDPADYNYGKSCKDHLGNDYKTIKNMCENYGITYEAYLSRKKRGWELEKILTTPLKNYKWRTPARNMGIPLSKSQRKRYKDYEETPGTRAILQMNKK